MLVTKNLVLHYESITKDISAINEDLTNAQYEPAGEAMADLTVQVLGEIPADAEMDLDKLKITMW